MSGTGHVVVVGASAAGVAVADTLRGQGYRNRLTLIGAESHAPYDRPPLSKEVLAGTREPGDLRLRRPGHYERHGIDLCTGRRAVHVDAANREIFLDSGEKHRYDVLVAATGLVPRRLPRHHDIDGVHELRTLDDLTALQARLSSAGNAPRVVVLGGGFLGMEVAATCLRLGADVSVATRHQVPLLRQVGAAVGEAIASLHREQGVRLHTGVDLLDVTHDERKITGAVLTDKTIVPADIVLVAIGADPQTSWLTGNGLDLRDGVGCDSHCRAAPGIYAAGDVARWRDDSLGADVRVEHRMNATEQGMHVAREILGAAQPYSPTPYAWSDQYETRIQMYGHLGDTHDMTIVEGSLADRRCVVLYGKHGRVTGALAWRAPSSMRRVRDHVVHRAPWDEANKDHQPTGLNRTAAATTLPATSTPAPQESRGALL